MSGGPDVMIDCDGLCEPRNPGGVLCWAWIARNPQGVQICSGSGCVPAAPANTNNQAEYDALLAALEWAYRQGHRSVHVRSDSQLMIRQIQGAYECNAAALVPRLGRVRKAQAYLTVTVEWVPREENTVADALTRAAYAHFTGRVPPERVKRPKLEVVH